MKYTNATLAAMSLKELAAIVNKPSVMKLSKAKAIAYVLKHAPAATKAATAKTPEQTSKQDKLLEALSTGGNRQFLMDESGFDNKNLSVSMSIMKSKGYVISIEVDADGERMYQLK